MSYKTMEIELFFKINFWKKIIMKDWEYNELFEAIQETFEELLDDDRGKQVCYRKTIR